MPPTYNNQSDTREILRLTQENNRMLHSMRRHSLLGGLFKLIIYIILFAAPIWFYMTYISSSVDNLVSTLNKIQGSSAAAQNKFSGLEEALKSFESHLPAFMQPGTTSTTVKN